MSSTASPATAGPPPPGVPTEEQRANVNYITLASFVLVTWEIVLHSPLDLKYLRMKDAWKSPVIWAYFLQRYGAWIVIMAQVNILLGTPGNCYAFGKVALTFGGAVVLPSVSLIYLYRVLAIWDRSISVKYTLFVLWVLCLGASLTAPFSQKAANIPTGGCTIVRSEKWAPISFIANAGYDTVIFILTVYRLVLNRHQHKSFDSPIQATFLRDGVLYFFIAVVIGIVDIAFLMGVKNPVVSSTIIPLHIALTSIMTTRLVANVLHVVGEGSSAQYKASAMSSKSAIFIGSGVGTDHFDRSVADGGGLRTESRPEKRIVGSQTYAIPMQLTSSGARGAGSNV
ncbi:hypothetical protein CC1G_02793 [Coprinopsis cinerea okayama7|uniref:Integral membrane protein n=1 Tax=Coprinopsis cinerea (strain Okayama-7 / 130 / ATCC MYA-4618 / FGSC 9003) TaxID=240176 RepID=A8N023_COPC7|nr:hypothetical protein CC1G_02793 [Coprinopsis cinerea okayama7\|eukprot:XP_001828212.1 hypothetical protein CC1G_02793 [Coprinopsis cinerea okayama7\